MHGQENEVSLEVHAKRSRETFLRQSHSAPVPLAYSPSIDHWCLRLAGVDQQGSMCGSRQSASCCELHTQRPPAA